MLLHCCYLEYRAQTYVVPYSSWGIYSLLSNLMMFSSCFAKTIEHVHPTCLRIVALKDCSVVYGLRDTNCVKCNAVHIVSEMWIEIANLNYTTDGS